MPPKTVIHALIDMLSDLDENQIDGFCAMILDRREEPKVRRNDLRVRRPVDIAQVLVTVLTEAGARRVALETLQKIGCNAQRESLEKDLCEVPVFQASFVSNHGNIMEVETTGASLETARQDRLKGKQASGVEASYAMAEIDLIEMNNYRSIINNAAHQKGLDPALIAAMISRSCRAGRTLTEGKGCYNEKRKAYDTFGLMQINVHPEEGGHTPRGSWDSEEHLCQAADILLRFIICIKRAFPDWTKAQQLKGGIAAYNAGDLNIHSYEEVDAHTSGGDYSNDVVARAHWYKQNGGF